MKYPIRQQYRQWEARGGGQGRPWAGRARQTSYLPPAQRLPGSQNTLRLHIGSDQRPCMCFALFHAPPAREPWLQPFHMWCAPVSIFHILRSILFYTSHMCGPPLPCPSLAQALEESRGRGGRGPSLVSLELQEVTVEGYGPFRWVRGCHSACCCHITHCIPQTGRTAKKKKHCLVFAPD